VSTKTTQAAVLAAAHVYHPAPVTVPMLVRDTGLSFQTVQRALEHLGYQPVSGRGTSNERPTRYAMPERVPFTVLPAPVAEPVEYEQLSNGLTPENSILVRYIPVSAHEAKALFSQNLEKMIDHLRNPTQDNLEKVAVTLVSLAKNWEDLENKV